ncbi:MAG: hypothetical protein GY816_09830 [Cytophagales bacterium]|nr:hypothetical protein [Cytophagales bacterium]
MGNRTRNPNKPGNKKVGIRFYVLADKEGFIMNMIPHGERKFKYSEKGALFGWIFALLGSENLDGGADEKGGENFLGRGHEVHSFTVGNEFCLKQGTTLINLNCRSSLIIFIQSCLP